MSAENPEAPPRVRVLLADDHRLVAEGLLKLLEPELEVIGIVEDGRALVETARAERPDLVIADVAMPQLGGIEATRELRADLPELKILMLSMHDDPATVRAAFEAGADGYLLKSTAITELQSAIDQVLQGGEYLTPSLAARDGTTESIRVLLVDDQDLVRVGIGHFLESFEDVEVVGEAKDGSEAVARAAELAPDVILMDLAMPEMDGIDATRAILEHNAGARVLVLSSLDSPASTLAAVRAGAIGYLRKNASPTELHRAVCQVADGEPFLPPAITEILLGVEDGRDWPLPDLTRRELEIVRLVARGLTNHQLSEQLFIAEVTVRTHLRNIYEKFEVANRVELVLYALRAGWALL